MDLDVNKRGGVYWLDTDTANAMSMPNEGVRKFVCEALIEREFHR